MGFGASEMPRRGLLLVSSVLAVTAVLFGAWLSQTWGGAATTRAIDDVGLLVFALFATGCASWAARRARGRHRLIRLSLSLGLATRWFGVVVWCYQVLWKGVD